MIRTVTEKLVDALENATVRRETTESGDRLNTPVVFKDGRFIEQKAAKVVQVLLLEMLFTLEHFGRCVCRSGHRSNRCTE